MHSFSAPLEIIGINPYVAVPEAILEAIFLKAGRDKGAIPICGTVNGKAYTQTLVRFAGSWRLYVNMVMLKDSPRRIGEILELEVDFDPRSRALPLHPKLEEALKADPVAEKVYSNLSPSRQLEINRSISRIKAEVRREENIRKAILFLHGKGRFAGRDRP